MRFWSHPLTRRALGLLTIVFVTYHGGVWAGLQVVCLVMAYESRLHGRE
jgi:DMSO/TMAO reductase YedYZ heme-binding membrane subunit